MTKTRGTRGVYGMGHVGRPRHAIAPPSDAALLPLPGYVVVSGKSPLTHWNVTNYAAFNRLRLLAAEFGLIAVTFDAKADGLRHKFTSKRVRSEIAAATVADFPGITFDQWTLDLYMRDQPKNSPLAWKAARNRAKVMLSMLAASGLILKQVGSDGKLRLYPPGGLPEEAPREDPRLVETLLPEPDPRIRQPLPGDEVDIYHGS